MASVVALQLSITGDDVIEKLYVDAVLTPMQYADNWKIADIIDIPKDTCVIAVEVHDTQSVSISLL